MEVYPFSDDKFHWHDDICLVFPDAPFEINDFVKPIPLGDYESCSIGQQCVTSGFGAVYVRGILLFFLDQEIFSQTLYLKYKFSFLTVKLILKK